MHAGPGYLPLADYAAIGDCRSVALVGHNGSIDWLCWPHYSSAAVFAGLLDARTGGAFAVRPAGEFQATRRYRGDTAVLETIFETETGRVRLTDAMAVAPDAEGADVPQPSRELLRRVEGIDGAVDVAVSYRPRPGFARRPFDLTRRGACGWACTSGDELFLLRSDIPLSRSGDGLAGSVRVARGEQLWLSLSYTSRDIGIVPLLGDAAQRRLDATQTWWEAWSRQCRYDGPYRAAVVRSLVTLKMLASSLTGAVVAAPTASLPEAVGGSRNWDYRFCWLRDASLTLRAFLATGCRAEAESYLEWLLHATRLTWPTLNVLYDVHGRTDLTERTLDHLDGWRGSRPVRVGNGAHGQLQLDVYGEVIRAALDFADAGGRLDRATKRLLAGFGRSVCGLWREPDCGIWEVRTRPRQFTFSKVMCWVALDSLLRLHERDPLPMPAGRVREVRDGIEQVIETRGFDARLGSYVSTLDGDDVDASLLLMPLLGYRPADDLRMRGTLHLVLDRLGSGALVRRYGRNFDGFAEPEGAFAACGFWATDVLARTGDTGAARRRFEALLALANDVGLYGEEHDADTGEILGNFPQAFTHVALIHAALSLSGAGTVRRSETSHAA